MAPMVYIRHASVLYIANGLIESLTYFAGLFAVLVYLAAIRVDDP